MTLSSPYTIDDWRAEVNALLTNEEFQKHPAVLVDRTRAEAPSTAFVDALVDAIGSFAPVFEHARVAILVGDNVAYGMARMMATKFELRSGGPPMAVFRDETSAMEWLIGK